MIDTTKDIKKGDPVDVANFCMMLRHYEAKIVAPIAAQPTSYCGTCEMTVSGPCNSVDCSAPEIAPQSDARDVAIVKAALEAAGETADVWVTLYVDEDHSPAIPSVSIRALDPQSIINSAKDGK